MGYFVRFNRRLLAGDLQMKALIEGQPMKFAAMEGAYEDSDDPAA